MLCLYIYKDLESSIYTGYSVSMSAINVPNSKYHRDHQGSD